jgi:hypothetical protein
MNLLRFRVRTLVAALLLALPAIGFAVCDVRSGPKKAALVELYTSEGCSSCPPAESQLSRLRQTLAPDAEVVPIALHVGYWDYIGWKDPYAQGAFGERQGWLVRASKKRTVYTPQFFVGGTELRSWQDRLRDTVRQINMSPATTTIQVRGHITAKGALALDAEATAQSGNESAALYLALAESGLVSNVTRGENSGVTLTHDHVVREWIGPIRFAGGAASLQRDIALSPEWNRARLDVVAFVQENRTGSVLQALSAQHCAGF